jgi:hypothetical protein
MLEKMEEYREVAALSDDDHQPRLRHAVLEEALVQGGQRHDVAGA